MKKCLAFILPLVIGQKMCAQNTASQKPGLAPEASQFDFWVGGWELPWNDTSHGTNRVLELMDGYAVN